MAEIKKPLSGLCAILQVKEGNGMLMIGMMLGVAHLTDYLILFLIWLEKLRKR